MKRFLVLICMLMLSVSVLTAQGSSDTAGKPAEPEYVLKLGYSSPTSNPWHICAEQLAAYVANETQGRVRIDLFPAEMLGSDKQMSEMIKMGTLDMQIAPQGVVAIYEPKMAVLELPFLFDSNEKVAALLEGPLGTELAKDLPAQGIRVLAYWENGLRQTTNSKRPILVPEDLKGMKIRTPDNKMTISIFKALGANPAPLAYNELYLALSQGVFDGQENPVVNIHASKLYEVQKYISMTNHKYEGKPFIVSEKVWKKLPADIQAVIEKGAKMYAIENRRMFAEQDATLLADLQAKGMQVSRPDLEPFRKATSAVYDEWKSVFGADLVNRVIQAAK